MFKSFATCATAAILAALPLPALADEAGGLRALCYAPTELAQRAGEKIPVRRQHAYDTPQPARQLAPYQPVPSTMRGAIRRVNLPKGAPKLIALTFDLCEQPGEIAGYDGAIFDYLRAHGIKATFFAGGKWLRSHAERSRQIMSDPLFEIASHSEAHRNLRSLSGTALQEEIAGPQRAFEALRSDFAAGQCVAQQQSLLGRVPQRMSLFRFPYGACNAQSLAAVADAGLLAIQWDLSTGDPSPAQSAKAIAQSMLSRAKAGSIVIMHANGRAITPAMRCPWRFRSSRNRDFSS